MACSQHHNVEQRLARCLLTMSRYADGGEFLLAQHSIAALLGVRRVSISDAARKFQAARMIHYSRGRITVLNDGALGKKSCECFRFIIRRYRSPRVELPRLLTT